MWKKLAWVNRHYLQANQGGSTEAALAEKLQAMGVATDHGPALAKVVEVMAERADTVTQMAEQSVYFYQDFEQYDENAAKKQLRPVAQPLVQAVRDAFARLDDWQAASIHAVLMQTIEALDSKIGKVGPPLRVATTGSAASPSLDITLELIGKERVLARIDRAIEFMQARNNAE